MYLGVAEMNSCLWRHFVDTVICEYVMSIHMIQSTALIFTVFLLFAVLFLCRPISFMCYFGAIND